MLAIRLTRTGRKGHAQYRMIVQEARLTPTSGRIVAPLGSYNPHTKAALIDKDKASFYLEHGAQPSDRVARLLKKEGVTLPKWVQLEKDKVRSVRKPDKLRKNQPAETKAAEAPAEEATPVEKPEAEAPVENTEATAEQPSEETETTAAPPEKAS